MHQCCGGLDCNRAFDQCAAPAPPGSTLFNTALAVAPADVRATRGTGVDSAAVVPLTQVCLLGRCKSISAEKISLTGTQLQRGRCRKESSATDPGLPP